MRAAPHLLHRLRRWLALQSLELHARQLSLHIETLEADLCADQHALQCLRRQLAATEGRLAAARLAPRAAARARRRIRTGD